MGRHNVVLLLTGERAAAYIERGRHSVLVNRARNPAADVAEEVDSLLASLPLQAGKVWVLSSELWTGSVGMANEVMRRVEKHQLSQMAAFEVEPLSGIGANQARTAVAQLGTFEGQLHLWVTQVESEQFARVAESVSFNGGKLQAMLHPAGVPAQIGLAAGAKSWQRLEIWNDAAILVEAENKAVQWRFLPNAVGAIYDPDRLDALRKEHASGELQVLFDTPQLSPPAESAAVEFVSLADEAVLRTLMKSWAQALVSKAPVPLIVAPRAAMSARSKQILTAGLAALALIVCGGHYQVSAMVNQSRVTVLNKQIAELQAPTKAAAEERKKMAELQKTQAEAVTKQKGLQEAIVNYQEVMVDQRQRIPTLLKSLAKSCDRQVLIQQIECDGSEIRIHGRCLDPRQAKSLATELAKDLESLNLNVELPTTEALNLTANGGPHQFELVLRDRGR